MVRGGEVRGGDSRSSGGGARAAAAIDAAVLALLVAGHVVAALDGFRWGLGPLRVSASTPSRLVLSAVALVLLRRWRWPGARGHPWAAAACAWIRRRFDAGRSGPPAAPLPPATAREWTSVVAVFAAATAVLLFRQVAALHSVPDFGDPLFSIWRLSWVAHQLSVDPAHLFDANIFHPELRTLAYSDAMLGPALIAAPFLRFGCSPVLVYNVVLLSSFVAAGVAAYALARRLTGHRAAALVCGVAFAFYPFRFEHYSHLELEITCWSPWALLWLHEAIASRRTMDAVKAGVFTALQLLSSWYCGLFLAVMMAVVWGVEMCAGSAAPRRRDGGVDWRAAVGLWLPAAALVALVVLPASVPYLLNHAQTGDRPAWEARLYSATPWSFFVATGRSLVYGRWLDGPRFPELALFPGIGIVALAAAGAGPRFSATRGAYIVAALILLEGALGANGIVFPLLRDYLLPFRGLRAPARFTVLLALALAVLAAFGVVRLQAWCGRLAARLGHGVIAPPRRLGAAVPIVCSVILLAENFPVLDLVKVPAQPPAVYAYFEGAAPSALADLPFPAGAVEATQDARFLYFSTFHWQRLLTGSSGYFPASFGDATLAMKKFPTMQGIEFLQRRGVEFVVVAREMMEEEAYEEMLERLDAAPQLMVVRKLMAPGQRGAIYRVLPPR